MTGKDLPNESEIGLKEYTDVKMQAMKDMNMEIAAIKTGKTKEDLEKAQKTKGWWGKYMSGAFFLLLAGRFIWTKYRSSKASIPVEDIHIE